MWRIVSPPNIKENVSSHRGHRRCLCRITELQGFESRWLHRSFYLRSVCDPCKTFQNFHQMTLKSAAKTHRFSALVSSCWGSDYAVTSNLLVSTSECLTKHPAARNFPQQLNWFKFHNALSLNIQILNSYLRYSDILRCQNSQGRQHWLVNQKHCNLLWLELVNALCVWLTYVDTLTLFNLFRSTNWLKPTELAFVSVLGKLQRWLNITERLQRGL